MQPLVSVVVPTYNVERYLDRCLKSITEQTYKNIEIIIVDDGSPDNCPAMCDDWAEKDDRIKVIHKQNAGLGMARNTGIENATGKYICFFDSDDYIDVSLVEKCVTAITESNAQTVIFGSLTDNGTKVIPTRICTEQKEFKGKSVQNELLPGFFTYDLGFGISCCMQMIELSVIKDNGVRFKSERELLSEDAFFILELYKHISSAVILPENLYYYYNNETSLSRSYKKDFQTRNNAFLQKSLQLCDELGYEEKVKLHIEARYRMYTLAGMKQIIAAEISKKEKRVALKAFFNDETLKFATNKETLQLDGMFTRVFWKLFRKKFYHICYLMLWYKTKR